MPLTWQIDKTKNLGPAPYDAPAIIESDEGIVRIARLLLVATNGTTSEVTAVTLRVEPGLTGAALRAAVIAEIEKMALAWEVQSAGVTRAPLGAIPDTPTEVVI